MVDMREVLLELEQLNKKQKAMDSVNMDKRNFLKEYGRTAVEFGREVVRLEKKLKRIYAKSPDEKLEKVIDFLEIKAELASKLLRDKNYLGLTTLFISRGSKEGDPNQLEILMSELSKTL